MNEIPETPFLPASRKRRIAAFMIDHMLLTFLMVSITFLALGPNFMDDDSITKMGATMAAVMIPGFLLYFGKDSMGGKSPGKWVMGIMVRDVESPTKNPSIGKMFVRNLFLIIWPVEFIVLATSEERKRLGDKTVKAWVVRNPEKPGKAPRIGVIVIIAIAFFSFLLLFVGAAMKNSEAYKVAVSEIERNQEIVSETGGINGYGMMPSGNISIRNGVGEAQFEITVLGAEKDLKVQVLLMKELNGDWELIEMNK